METDRLQSALAVLTVDPAAVGGLWLRARACPLRSRLTDLFALLPLPLPLTRLPPMADDQALFGGLDITATLASGQPVLRGGLLDRNAVLILPMAERCAPGLAARLAQTLDQRRHALIALDESAEDDEGLPPALADRLGLFLDLSDLRDADAAALMPQAAAIIAARALLPAVRLPHDAVRRIVNVCAGLGVVSLRAPMLTLNVARVLAALAGRGVVEEPDLQGACALVLAHRAAPLSEMLEQPPPPPPPPPPAPPADDSANDSAEPPPEPLSGLPLEILVDAARAALPSDVLAQLAEQRAQRAAGGGSSGSGSARIGNRRGRPMPARKGKPQGDARIDLIATLRAAAPWQPLRRAEASGEADQALLVAPGDLHLKRAKELSDRLLIFAVDASGSAAVARLAEAKGAVELLLAQAYSRRDHVALLTFRGQEAALLLPPSRSLVQTKARLRGLPGGGGTPLAHGLQLALQTARQAKGRGMTPTIAVLTDGRGNIALDGSADRVLAEEQALKMAQAIRSAGTSAVVIDVAQRPNPRLRDLATRMGALYVALPRATAGRLADVLGAALEA